MLPTLNKIGNSLVLCKVLPVFVVLTAVSLSVAYAQDADTSLRLQQRIDSEARQQERQILQHEDYFTGDRPTLAINGKTYTVEANANDVGRALYVSIQQRQWPAVVHFLTEYQRFEDADPMLLSYARGALARVQGNFTVAESEFRGLLTHQPNFMLGQLELARVLFENRKDYDAEQLFQHIARTLDPAEASQQGVLATVDSFLQATQKRQSWQASIAVGPTWSNNLNQSSESYTCLYFYNDFCLFERATPKAVKAMGVDYEMTLNKRFALSGHHGLFFRTLYFGQSYNNHSMYNESQLNTQFGYSYHTARSQYALAPVFELARYDNRTTHGAWGVHGEWMHTLSHKLMFKLEADYTKQRYRTQKLAKQYNGDLSTSYATLWYVLPYEWTLFGGADWARKRASVAQNAYRQVGVRAGLAKNFGKHVNAVLFASVRERRHDAYSPLLEARRRDVEQNYTLIFRFPTLSVFGIEPNLSLKRRKVNSNVDWLYSYNRDSISLKLEKRF